MIILGQEKTALCSQDSTEARRKDKRKESKMTEYKWSKERKETEDDKHTEKLCTKNVRCRGKMAQIFRLLRIHQH